MHSGYIYDHFFANLFSALLCLIFAYVILNLTLVLGNLCWKMGELAVNVMKGFISMLKSQIWRNI